jgi:hypothetical protein
LATEDESRRINLLKNGFLPDDKRVLIEAGLRCMPLISPEGDRKVTVAAAGRLKAITSKLRLMPTDADVYHALAEFDAKLKEHERRETQHLLIGLGMVVIAVLIMSGVIFVLNRVLF